MPFSRFTFHDCSRSFQQGKSFGYGALAEVVDHLVGATGGFRNAVRRAQSLLQSPVAFYEHTGDTAKYFKIAIPFIEWHYMSLSADSIQMIDSLSMKQLFTTAAKDTVREGSGMRITSRIPFRPAAQSYMATLNNAAWNIYKITSNPWRLSTALRWATKALEFYRSPEALDTYAKLSYRLGEKQHAIRAMEEAIALKKKNGFPTMQYEKDLKKIRNNEAVE